MSTLNYKEEFLTLSKEMLDEFGDDALFYIETEQDSANPTPWEPENDPDVVIAKSVSVSTGGTNISTQLGINCISEDQLARFSKIMIVYPQSDKLINARAVETDQGKVSITVVDALNPTDSSPYLLFVFGVKK